MHTVNEINKSDCTGCKLCETVCPVNAINFATDNKGFWYPIVDSERCINCGKCVSMCPSLQENLRCRGNNPKVYAAWSKNDEIRLNSTSGGIFYELASWFIKEGGAVAGCRYTPDWRGAEHFLVQDMKGLIQIMGSKYYQSNTSGIYQQVKEQAEKGKKILFAGSPCQVTAMKAYLGNCDHVYFVDFICRSINSPKAFKAYIDELEGQYQSKVVRVRLKDKTRGWQSLASHVYFENGEDSLHDRNDDYWINGFLGYDLYTRESCYHCKYRQLPRVTADISIGDFWGIQGKSQEDMFKGISVILLNTNRGEDLFHAIREKIVTEKHSIAEVVPGNPALIKSPSKTNRQEQFFKLLEDHTFSYAVSRCINKNTFEKLWSFVKINAGRCKRIIITMRGVSISKFIYFNFLSKNIVRKEGWLIPYKNAILDLDKDSRIYIEKGTLKIGINKLRGSRAETHVRMNGNAIWKCHNGCLLFYNTVLEIKPQAVFDSGFFSVNGGSVIIVDKKVTFGEDVMIGRNVLVYDSDFHQLRDKDGMPFNFPKEVVIEDHVWLTSNIAVLKGVTIGRDSLVTSETVITKSVPEHCIIGGGTAGKVINDNVNWSRASVREMEEWFYQASNMKKIRGGVIYRKYSKIYSFIYTKIKKNIFCKAGTFMFFYPCNTWIKMHPSAVIHLESILLFNGNAETPNGRSTLMKMEKNSILNVKKNFTFFYGADIQLFAGATLTIGNSFINCNCKIRCFESITIGDRCAISHEVTIIDADGHEIDGRRESKPIVIENDVWIGTRVTILKGVHIHEGAVIAAGAVVTHDIPPRCMVAGVPAKIVRQNITWNS